MRVGLKTCWSEIESVRLRSERRSTNGEIRLEGSGNESSAGKLLKKKVPLSVLLPVKRPSRRVVNWCCSNSEGRTFNCWTSGLSSNSARFVTGRSEERRVGKECR